MTEIKFDCLNKAIAEDSPYDLDTSFISIACDAFNACASVSKIRLENGVITKYEAHDDQLKLIKSAYSYIGEMIERWENGELPIAEEE